MVTRVYKSTDSGAPVLNGVAGSVHTLLQAILIDGIGGAPASPWTIEFSDTASKTKVYRPPGGNRHYLQVADNGAVGDARDAAFRGYGAMTAYNTGTDPFPSTAQLSGGLFIRKSATLDSAARNWRAYVDEKTLYLFVDSGDVPGSYMLYAFGQYLDWVPSGAWASMAMGKNGSGQTSNPGFNSPMGGVFPNGTSHSSIYAPRGYSQAAGAVLLGAFYDSAAVNSTAATVPGTFGQGYPYVVDGGIIISPLRLAVNGILCGRLRGLWMPGHNKPLVQDDTFNATEGTLTRGMVAQNFLDAGQLFMESTNTWDTE